MDELVFYCAPCQQTFAGKLPSSSSWPKCPRCNRPTQSTGFAKELWVQMPKDQRDAKLNALAQERAIAEQQEAERQQRIAQSKAYAHSIGVSYKDFTKHNVEGPSYGFYTNIGKKIKRLAKWLVIFESIVLLIFANILMPIAYDAVFSIGILVGLLFALVFAWVSSWLLYGFGELIDKTADNERNTQAILKLLLDSHQQDEK